MGKIFLNSPTRRARRKTEGSTALQSKLDAVSSTYSEAIVEVENMLTCLDMSFTHKEKAEAAERDSLLLEIEALKTQLSDKDEALKLTTLVNGDLEARLVDLSMKAPKVPKLKSSSRKSFCGTHITREAPPVVLEAPPVVSESPQQARKAEREPVAKEAAEWEPGQEFEATMHEANLGDTCTMMVVGRVAGAGMIGVSIGEVGTSGVTFAQHQGDKFLFGLRKVCHKLPRHLSGRTAERRSFTHTLKCGPTVLCFNVRGGKSNSILKITQQMAGNKDVLGHVEFPVYQWDSLIELVEAMITLSDEN